MCGYFGLHVFLSWLCVHLFFVFPVLGNCYYDTTYAYYDCYTNIGLIVGAVVGGLFGMAILVAIILVICSVVKTQGNRGHVVRPTNIANVQTVQYTTQQQSVMYPPTTNAMYPPPPPNYGPPPVYPGAYS